MSKRKPKDLFLDFIKLSKGEHPLKEVIKLSGIDWANITHDSIIDSLPKPKITMNDLESYE